MHDAARAPHYGPSAVRFYVGAVQVQNQVANFEGHSAVTMSGRGTVQVGVLRGFDGTTPVELSTTGKMTIEAKESTDFANGYETCLDTWQDGEIARVFTQNQGECILRGQDRTGSNITVGPGGCSITYMLGSSNALDARTLARTGYPDRIETNTGAVPAPYIVTSQEMAPALTEDPRVYAGDPESHMIWPFNGNPPAWGGHNRGVRWVSSVDEIEVTRPGIYLVSMTTIGPDTAKWEAEIRLGAVTVARVDSDIASGADVHTETSSQLVNLAADDRLVFYYGHDAMTGALFTWITIQRLAPV